MRLSYRQLMTKTTILFLTASLSFFAACTKSQPPPAPHGNGQGYERERNLIVEKNLRKAINLNDTNETGEAIYSILQAPKNGKIEGAFESTGLAEFKPSADYIGPDFFTYERMTMTGAEIIGVFVDVVPCFRIPTTRVMNENLHVIATQFAEAEVEVKIEKGTAPAILVLSAQDSAVQWRIILAEGAEVAKVVLHDEHGASTVAGLPESVEVVRRNAPGAHFWEPIEHFAFNNFNTYIEGIRNLLGENEGSFQGCQNLKKATIPLSPATMAESCGDVGPNYAPYAKSYPSHYLFANQQCQDKCSMTSGPAYTVLDASKKSSTVTLSSDGLTASAGSGGGIARTVSGPRCGKYYYEVRVNQADDPESIQLGLARESSPANDMEFGLIYNGSDLLAALSNPQTPLLVSPSAGDLIGVALDLDAGVVYFSKNGAWQKGGDPVLGTGGSSLGLYFYEPILAGANVIWRGSVTFNFGESAFSYTAPVDFRASNLPPL